MAFRAQKSSARNGRCGSGSAAGTRWQSVLGNWIDFDSDGSADLLSGTVIYRQAANSFVMTTNVLEATFTRAVCDMDADGDDDVIGAYNSDIILS